MKFLQFIFVFMLVLSSIIGFAQSDKRIKPSEILPSIPLYIDQNYPDHGKVVYYSETINDTVYCEAIFQWKKDEISTLFDKNGKLYGTEIVLPFNELPKEIQTEIYIKLKELFVRYDINKTEELELNGKLMYELFLEAKTKDSSGYFEVYFDRDGQYIKVLKTELVTIPNMF